VSADLQLLHTSLQKAFADHSLEQEKAEEKTTFALRKGWTSGLDVEVEAGEASVEWSTKVGTLMLFVVLGQTLALMMLFAEPMLEAMGLIADAGSVSFTLKLLYIIPMLVFLVPLMILGSMAQKRLAPPQESLLVRAREVITAAGLPIKAEAEAS